MSDTKNKYTYRGGVKLPLTTSAAEFVARADPERLAAVGIGNAEQLSPGSSKVAATAGRRDAMMAQASAVAAVSPAYVTESGEEFLVTDRVLVTFAGEPPREKVDELAGRYGLIQQEAYSPRDYLFQLTPHTGMDAVDLVVKLTEDEPLVETAENDLNFRVQTYQFTVPSDTSYARQWHLHTSLTDAAFDARASSRCEQAWRTLDNYGSEDVVIGVTDDGCKLNHPDFDSPGKFAGWGYFRGTRLVVREDIDADPSQMYKPGANHGTSCAGVIAGEADAVLTVGAAPGCRLLPIQWESSGPSLFISDSKLLTALNYMADKVDVISNSWGSSPASMFATVVVNRITALSSSGGRRGRGIVFLWAAGNENCPIQHTADVDVPYNTGWQFNGDGTRTWIGVSTARQFRHNLVALPGVMYVAALASNAQRSHYSNYGAGIALCAPSSNVHLYGRASVTGLGITTATGSAGSVTPSFGGTSSATPLAAGIAALTISAHPGLTAAQVIGILKRTAAKDLNMSSYPRTPPANYDPQPLWDVSPVAPYDHGDFADIGSPEGTWSPWFGHGRVDAAAAVAAAIELAGGTGTGLKFTQTSRPERQIPDNVPAGISDKVHFDDSAKVASLKVTVDIMHSYIGDLRLTLTAPSGKAVVLHDRNGGAAANLRRDYDVATVPALASLAGEQVEGDWTLTVQDLAPADAGMLNRWGIDITGRADNAVEMEESPGIALPDNQAGGVEREMTVAADGAIEEVAVAIDITHTYIGDLTVALVSPGGASVMLHNRAGAGQDNLIKTYTPANTAGLAALRGSPTQGTWRLRVSDLAAADTGKLNRWSLRIQRQGQVL